MPRHQRWEIDLEGKSLAAYSKQLDFFGIEIGAFDLKTQIVAYASKFTGDKPTSRTARASLDKRFNMGWQSGPLQEADRDLLRRAGIKIEGKVIRQFYSAATETMLAQLEHKYAPDREVNEIRKTKFVVRPAEGGYEFVVVEQRYFQ